MVKPFVSVIIPLYNAEQFIYETLDSVGNQTYENWECIIVDDGSTDQSFEVVQNYCLKNNKFKLFKRPDSYKSGGSGARNYGFDISKGQFIQWFDSDDVMHPSMLERKVSLFSEINHAIICQTVPFKDTIKNVVGKPTAISSENSFVDFFSGKITYYTPGPMWKKSFLQDVNLRFNEDLLNIQEWEFYCRILLQENLKVDYIKEALIYYRKHENSIWGRGRSETKIMSEFNGARTVYDMSTKYRSEISGFYFQRVCKLYVELRGVEHSKKRINELKEEMYKSYILLPFKIRNFFKFIKYYYLNK